MGKITDAIKLIQDKFPQNWWENHSFHKTREEDPQIPEKLETFIKSLNEIEESIFDCLNISIIRGEYIEESDHKLNLLKLKTFIKEIQPTVLEFPDDEINNFFFNQTAINSINSGFIEPLLLAVNYYHEFLLSVERKLNVSQKQYITGSYNDEITRATDENLCDENSKNNLQLLQLNIIVAQIDHSLTIDSNQLSTLMTFKSRLSSLSVVKPYALLISMKANFLGNKLKLRIKHENKGKRLYNVINTKEVEVALSKMLTNGIYDDWLKYSNVYTLDSELKEFIKLEFETLRNKPLEGCNVLELHKRIKYFKDVDTVFPNSSKQIEDIKEEFKKRLEAARKNNNLFDIYAYSICLNYTANNHFSIVCEQEASSVPFTELDVNKSVLDIEKVYNSVVGIQSETGIKNFFPQVKFLKFLIGKLKTIFDENKAIGDIERCNSIIEKSHSLDKTYEENVNWTTRNYNYVFQLPFEECCLESQDENVDRVFIFSSFLLPLPKRKIFDEYKDQQKDVFQYESSIKIYKNIKAEIKVLEAFKEDLKGLKDKDSRMFEVLGVFTAIISFVAASLPTFKVIDTPLEAALFMLALGTSLSWFVFLLLLAFGGKERIKERRNLMIGWFIAGVIIWGLLIGFSFLNPLKTLNTPKDTNEKPITILQNDSSEINIASDSQSIDPESIKPKDSPKKKK